MTDYMSYQDLPTQVKRDFERLVNDLNNRVLPEAMLYLKSVHTLLMELKETDERSAKFLALVAARPIEVVAAEVYNLVFEDMPQDVREVYNVLYKDHWVLGKVG